MSPKKWLARALLYVILELGALCGVPIRPDQIENLLKLNERAAATDVKRNDDREGPKP